MIITVNVTKNVYAVLVFRRKVMVMGAETIFVQSKGGKVGVPTRLCAHGWIGLFKYTDPVSRLQLSPSQTASNLLTFSSSNAERQEGRQKLSKKYA